MKRTDLSELDALADMYQGRNKRIMQQASAELRLLRHFVGRMQSLGMIAVTSERMVRSDAGTLCSWVEHAGQKSMDIDNDTADLVKALEEME